MKSEEKMNSKKKCFWGLKNTGKRILSSGQEGKTEHGKEDWHWESGF